MSMNFLKEDCYLTTNMHCFGIEFHLDEEHRHGFHAGQLIDYTLEPNPDAEDDKNAPPQKLALAFSTADVVVLGWRLGRPPTPSAKTNSPPSASSPNATPTSTAINPSSPPLPSSPLPRANSTYGEKDRQIPN